MSSFDVFDTAVCRLVHAPEHLHLIVGRKLRNRGIVALSEFEWMYARIEAESRQRLTVHHKEVKLEEIYEMLSTLIKLEQSHARIALEIELEEELRLIRPIASTRWRICELLRGHNPVMFVSDTYFSARQVEMILRRSGYVEPLDIITSSEELKSKISGTIFNHVVEQRNLEHSRIRHLGDNAFSDVLNARACGWNAQLFTHSHWTTRDRVLFASGEGDFLSSAIAGSARAARLGQLTPVKEGIATAAASVVGPLFAAYVLWVLLDVRGRGGRTIHFLARDGQVMVPMCQRLARWLGVEIDARYTYASRQAFLLPALPEEGDDIVDQALKLAYYDHITLSDAMTSLGFADEEMSAVSKNAAIQLHRTSISLSDKEKLALREALTRSDVLDPLRARARLARTATLAYLESENILSAAEAHIVDLGWRGNTQLRLRKVVGDQVSLTGYYMGLSNSVLGPQAKTRVWTTTEPLKTGLLEVMAAADHTSVKGFGFSKEGKPICSPPIGEDASAIQWGARQQQEIALRFVDYLTEAVESGQYTPEEFYRALRTAGLDAYRHFRLAPSFAEAEAYGGFLHQNDINHLTYRELARPVTGKDMAKHVFDRRSKAASSSWYMGSIARSREDWLPRLINTGVDKTINLMARVKTRRRIQTARRSARNALKET